MKVCYSEDGVCVWKSRFNWPVLCFREAARFWLYLLLLWLVHVLPFCDYFWDEGGGKRMERLILRQLLLKLLFKYFELVAAVNQGAVGDCISGIADP